MVSRSAMPLSAIRAVALDTETTGLDSAKARIVQIGALSIDAGHVDLDRCFETLVDPGVPIPPSSSAIHGIHDGDVVGAPSTMVALDRLDSFIAGRLLIGHNLGFDLAVIAAERQRLGLSSPSLPFLDTRLLGEVAFPTLPGYTLEILASRLSIAVDPAARHGARADAVLAATVFMALVEPLRQRGIRTVGEAQMACLQLGATLDGLARAGWKEPPAPGPGDVVLHRVDAFAFQHRVMDLMSPTLVTVSSTMDLRSAISVMTERRVSSLLVSDAAVPTQETAGIITERDVMRAINRDGAAALDAPVSRHMSTPLASVPVDAFISRAIGRMARLGIRHLGVTDHNGVVVAALSQRDLLRTRASTAIAIGDAVDAASTPEELALAVARMPELAAQLLAEEVTGRDIAAVVSREFGAATRRAAIAAEAAMNSTGRGPPPRRYAVLVLGSVGRGESLLAADQDNALIWSSDGSEKDENEVDAWFAEFGHEMTLRLDAAGIPFCKGGVMASSPAFRGSELAWRDRIRQWLQRTSPDDLLAVDIFFDFRAVHGDGALASRLFSESYAAASASPVLAKLLATTIEGYRPPFGLFGGFSLSNGRLDLKRHGLFPVVAAARCIALRHGLAFRSTQERLSAAVRANIGARQDLEAFVMAHATVMDVMLRQQVKDISTGRTPTTLVDPKVLGSDERQALKTALERLAPIADVVRDVLFR